MSNEIISPIFSEKNYQGKDIILEGIRIPLRGQYSLDLLDKFSNNSRRVIKLERPDACSLSIPWCISIRQSVFNPIYYFRSYFYN